MDFKIEFKTFRLHEVIIEAKNEEDARRIFNEKYDELEIDDGLGEEYSEITNVELNVINDECEWEAHMAYEIEQKPIKFRFSDMINQTYTDSMMGFSRLYIMCNPCDFIKIRMPIETHVRSAVMNPNNYFREGKTVKGNVVVVRCHICKVSNIWLVFGEDAVYNCELDEINPAVPSLCKACIGKIKCGVNELPEWTEEDTINVAKDEFRNRVLNQRSEMP